MIVSVKMNKQITILMLVILLAMPFVLAETETYPYNTTQELKYSCTLNNAIPSASAEYNITISYPNGTTFISNKNTTKLGNGAFSYVTLFPMHGLYKVISFCYDGTYSYSSTGYYEVTDNGKIAPSENVVIFFAIAFLLVLGFGLYQLILSLGHFASLDLDVVDLAKTIGVYFALLGLYQLSIYYLGNPNIKSFLLIAIRIGGFTHLIIPLIGFLISVTIGSLKKKKANWGTNRIYKRSKIGN